MKIRLFLLLITFAVSARAQEGEAFPDMRSWGLSYTDSSDRYVFADTAFVRFSPDTKQPPADTLFAGDNIRVTGTVPNALSIRGLKGPWLKISYQKNGVKKSGYIWQGLVSCTPLRSGDTKFVYAIERTADSTYFADNATQTIARFGVRLKVVQQGKVIARISFFTPNDESANFSDGKVMSGLGLSNVRQLVVLSFGGEACGIPTLDYYFAFTKNNTLLRFPGKMNVGDAGAYYHTETLTFPAEKNGKPDLVLWKMQEEEASEKTDRNGDPVLKVTGKESKTYSWNSVAETVTPVRK
jgi:hypothetical protein